MTHIVPGRAYTPEQKRAIIEKLYKIWLDVPTLRLCQLIYIVGGNGQDLDLFYMEDEALITELEKHIIPPIKALDFGEAITLLQTSAGQSSEDITSLSDAILRLAEDEQP